MPNDSELEPLLSKTQSQALRWFMRLQDHDVSETEKDAFARWWAADLSHQAAYDRVRLLWASPELDLALERFKTKPGRLPRRSRGQLWRVVAGCAAMICVMALIGPGVLSHWQADAVTATGEQRRLALKDGSRVLLNTGSAVKYGSNVGERGLTLLTGEAYFEVAPDASKPFIVKTAQGSIRVVGTHFSVKMDEATHVAVAEGKVVCDGKRGDSRQLLANQQLSITNQLITEPESIDVTRKLAWLKGRLVFRDEALEQVIAELDRYHPGVIVIADKKLGRVHITGSYKLADTTKVINRLADVANARVIRLTPYLTVLDSRAF